jgi:hypothetical protein
MLAVGPLLEYLGVDKDSERISEVSQLREVSPASS